MNLHGQIKRTSENSRLLVEDGSLKVTEWHSYTSEKMKREKMLI